MGTKRKIRVVVAAGVSLILLLALNIWPFHVRKRSTYSGPGGLCRVHLFMIDTAVEQWAIENGKTNGEPVSLQQIETFIVAMTSTNQFYIKNEPIQKYLRNCGGKFICPDGGQYSVREVGLAPTCSLGSRSAMEAVRDYIYGEEFLRDPRRHRLDDSVR
jgi:hypothetical protein